MTKANSIIMNIPYVILILVTIVLHFSYAITITNNDIVDICLIISNCSIDEISKYLINEGKNKRFTDITIRN